MKVSYIGDVMCLRDPELNPVRYPYLAGLAGLVADSDFVVANLESPIADAVDSTRHRVERYRFVSPRWFAEELHKAGVTHVSVANNHCLDQGLEGLKETLACVKAVGLIPFGARVSLSADGNAVLEKDGLRVGLFASTYGTNAYSNASWLSSAESRLLNLSQNQEFSNRWVRRLYRRFPRLYRIWKWLTNREAECWFDRKEVSFTKRRRMRAELQKIRKVDHVDFLVAYPHMGGQHRMVPMKSSQELGRWFIKNGADAVIGNHEHLVQRSEWVHGRILAYCLGNAVSYLGLDNPDDPKKEHCSVVLHQYVQKGATGGVCVKYAFSVIKTYMDSSGGLHTRPLHSLIAEEQNPAARAAVVAELNTIASRFLGREWQAAAPEESEHPYP